MQQSDALSQAPSSPTHVSEQTPLTQAFEQQSSLDALSGVIGGVSSSLNAAPQGTVLRGEWLGHRMHPAFTDVPIWCWTSTNLIDLLGGRRSRWAAQLLLGTGILAALPTVATGLTDFARLDRDGPRRVATIHALGNAAATVLYVLSWRARRRRHHLRGVAWALAGSGVATLAGFLGGHLAFGDPPDTARATAVGGRLTTDAEGHHSAS